MKKDLAIAVYVDDNIDIINEFEWLYKSFIYSNNYITSDIVAFCNPSVINKIDINILNDENVVIVPSEPLSNSDPIWSNYKFINSVYFLTTREAEILLNYEYTLSTDCDVFLTKNLVDLRPHLHTFGLGSYINDIYSRDKIVEIIKKLGLKYTFIHNVGASYLYKTKHVINFRKLQLDVCKYLMNNEFSGIGKWGTWFKGTLTMYAGEIVANQLDSPSIRTNILDSFSMSDAKISNQFYHIHAWHTTQYFSKHDFRKGEYKDIDVDNLDINLVNNYCLYLATKSIDDIKNICNYKLNTKKELNKISVLVININNLNYTKNCINDLLNQTVKNFNITLIDQDSTEEGTEEYFDSLSKYENINIKRNKFNQSIHTIWNTFYRSCKTDYLCYLNNDVKLTDNFIEDTINILDKDSNIGVVVHSTNMFKYNKKLDVLDYKFSRIMIKQGWDFTIRKSVYTLIPHQLKFYFGDDWIFHHVYKQNYKVAVCISSPIIHYGEKSSKYAPIGFQDEMDNFLSLGMKHYLSHYSEFTDVAPTYVNFGDYSLETFIYYNKLDIKDVYIDDEKFTKLNEQIMMVCNSTILNPPTKEQLFNIDQIIKDNIKIRVSVTISNAISNGYKKWGISDSLMKYTLPLYLEHLPNLKIIK